jgi:serine/threonine-protein kinase
MGTVFRVWDLKRNVPLAMKVLHAEMAEDEVIFERFKREARALRKLEHPNIVPFYGLYETPSLTFLLQRFIDGPTLKEVIAQNPGSTFVTEDILTIMKALCSAVGYAHNNNVIHCDIKSANIMIDKGGHIYLSDFGIARHAESDVTAMPGAGTPAYMAPEQILSNTVTKETDIYALGVLLFELLTGLRPFRGSENPREQTGNTVNERIRFAHLHVPAPDPRQLNPNLSPALSAVVLRALEKNPAARFTSCQDLFISLCEAVDTLPEMIPDQLIRNPQVPIQQVPQPAQIASQVKERPPHDPIPAEKVTNMNPQPNYNSSFRHNNQPNSRANINKRIFPVLIGIIVVLIGILVIPSLLKNNDGSTNNPGSGIESAGLGGVANENLIESIVATSIILTQIAEAQPYVAEADEASISEPVAPAETEEIVEDPTPAVISAEEAAAAFNKTESALLANAGYWSLYNRKQWVVYNHSREPLFLARIGVEKPKNFALNTLFTNPPNYSKDETWEIGVIFRYVDRDNYLRLRLLSNSEWYLENCMGDRLDCSVIDEGTIAINAEPSGQNMLKLLVYGTSGNVYFRGQYINDLDLSDRTNEGQIYVYTIFNIGNVRDGYTILYEKINLRVFQ